MKRLRMISAAAILTATGMTAALAQPSSINSVRFDGGPPQTAGLSGESATVYGDDRRALFQGDQAFVLGFAGNPAGTVYEWDVARRQVRISPDGQPAAWLSCSEVRAMPIACATSLRLSAEGNLIVGAAPARSADKGFSLSTSAEGSTGPAQAATIRPSLRRARTGAIRTWPSGYGVPNCPGDPRCPKVGN